MASFLQSPEWQDIQERMGRPTRRIRGILLIRHDIPFGFHYWYAPRPAPDPGLEFFSAAAGVARREKALFIKIDPTLPLPRLDSGLRLVPAFSLQPRATIRINCRQQDALLLAAMHSKTRYNIRLAERRGVSVRRFSAPIAPADFQTFHRLLALTAAREGFLLHPREHYRILLDAASNDFSNEIFVAEYAGQPVASALVNWYAPEKTATYLHGGSTRERQDLMAPHLLHWRIMQHVRERGCVTYDLGGIDERRWPGLTRFKSGFGGERVFFPPSADLVARPRLYPLYLLQRKLRHGRES